MKVYSTTLALVIAGLMLSTSVEGVKLSQAETVVHQKLDETTKKSVQRAAAAALSVAVAAKKAEAAESIRADMNQVHEAERQETSDDISAAIEKTSREEEKRAVEKAV